MGGNFSESETISVEALAKWFIHFLLMWQNNKYIEAFAGDFGDISML